MAWLCAPEWVTTDDGVLTAFALRSATDVTPYSLPVPATRLIGRTTELVELRELLVVHRLVTLAGPPGSGKTRLAVELARSALGTYTDGAWFVPLAPIPGRSADRPRGGPCTRPLGEAGYPDVDGRGTAPRVAATVTDLR